MIDYTTTSPIRLRCHVYFSIEWPCLYVNEIQIITIWMTSLIKFVFRLFIRLCLFSLSLSIEHSNLYFTSYSYSKSIYIYIYVLTNDALTQKVIVLLCSIHLTFDAYAWFELSHEWMVPAWIHMRIIINETKREEIFANRKNNYHSISWSPSLSFHHIIDNTLKWNVGDNSMSY